MGHWRSEILGASGCVTLALALLILPLRWILAWIVAAAVHECFHVMAVRLCGGKIQGFSVDACSAVITADRLSSSKALFCILAGPVGALSLLLIAKWFPATAVCALFQSAYNLLPLYPLDGGRAVQSIALMVFPPQLAEKICHGIAWLCLGSITMAAVYACVCLKLGFMPMIFAILLFTRTKIGKIPCKPTLQRVQ